MSNNKNNNISVYNKTTVTPPPKDKDSNNPVVQTEPKEGRFAALKRRAKIFIKGRHGKHDNNDTVAPATENDVSVRRKPSDERSTKQSRQSKNKKRTARVRAKKEDKDEAEVVARRKTSTGTATAKRDLPVEQQKVHQSQPVASPTPNRMSKESVTPPPAKQESQPAKPSREGLQQNNVPPPPPPLVMSADPVLMPNRCSTPSVEKEKKEPILLSAIDDGQGEKTQSLSESGKGPVHRSIKQRRKPSNNNNTEEEKVNPTAATQMTQEATKNVQQDAHRANVMHCIRKFYDRAIQLGVVGLVNEFKSFPKVQGSVAEHKTFMEKQHIQRNRYKDVPCVESTRVKVANNPDKHDYIHANYVNTELTAKKFICCQGPLAITVYEFWLMLLNEGCQGVVMLCNIMENNSCKCAQYWNPNLNEILTIKNIHIKTIQKMPLGGCTDVMVTVLAVKNPITNQTHIIKHYHWITWPDKGVPKDERPLLMILQEIRKYNSPTVVHCSAGIGRTGTVVIIELILEKFMRAQLADVPEILKFLRKQRANCVQTETQYLFIHFAIMHHFVRMCTISESYPGLSKFFNDYERICNAIGGGC